MWACAKYLNKENNICSIISFRKKYYLKRFNKNLNSISKVEEITKNEIIQNYDTNFKVVPINIKKNFDEKILKLNNLNIVNLDHNMLESLQFRGLLDKDLIKPLYLS